LEQPVDVTTYEGSYAYVLLAASDPDGDPIQYEALNPPAFVKTFPGRMSFDPGYGDAGTYTITVRVSDPQGLLDQKSFTVTVVDEHQPPSLERPSSMLGFVDQIAEQTIRAHDPEGNPLWFVKGTGPAWMTVSTTETGTGQGTGVIRLSPGPPDVGYGPAIIAVNNGFQGALAELSLNVFPNDRPAFMRVFEECVPPGQTNVDTLRGADPDGHAISFSATDLPPYSSLTDNRDGTAFLSMAPARADVGSSVLVTVEVSNGTSSYSERFPITVAGCSGVFAGGPNDPPPVARSGGPYQGLAGDPLSIDGTTSSDPQGEPLRFAWNLGDGTVAVGPSPSHTYAKAGTYIIDLIVDDGHSAAWASTSATIVGAFAARASLSRDDKTLRLSSGKPTLCVEVEPLNGSYTSADVDRSSIVMISANTGSASQIAALGPRATVRGNDPVSSVSACFGKEDLRRLFDRVAPGTSRVTVTIEGHLVTGGKFSSPLEITIARGNSRLEAAIAPNPLNPAAMFSFVTDKPGPVSVMVFDTWGRLIRTLLRQDTTPAGYHEVRFDGRGERGERLASGVYFYRITSPSGNTVGRLTIAR